MRLMPRQDMTDAPHATAVMGSAVLVWWQVNTLRKSKDFVSGA